jgi:hypothetical protein
LHLLAAANLASLSLSLLLSKSPLTLSLSAQGIGHTALHWAAAKGQLAAAVWLLGAGADADALNASDSTPLHSAVSNAQVAATVALVLLGGASLTAVRLFTLALALDPSPSETLTQTPSTRRTPLRLILPLRRGGV